MDEHRTPRRRRRALLVLVVSAMVGFVAAEGLLRVLLFSENESVARVGARLRIARRWADQDSEGLFWKLHHTWAPPGARSNRAGRPDPLLGWSTGMVTPGVFTHRAVIPEETRRPVLLYGDSYAQGWGIQDDCKYEHLFPSSEAASEYVLVNYGAGGFGFGQIYLMLRESIDNYVDREPVVVLSLLVENDLDRTLLDFRVWPKPVVHLENGELVVDLPTHLDVDEYLQAHPPKARSWLWRFLLRSPHFLPESWRCRLRGDAEILERKKRVNRAILEEIQTLLDSRGIEWFALLFVTEDSMNATSPLVWAEMFLIDLFEELDIPYVITRPDLWAWAEREGIDRAELYIQEGPGRNHHTRAGNEATLRTILRGLRKEFDPYSFVPGKR